MLIVSPSMFENLKVSDFRCWMGVWVCGLGPGMQHSSIQLVELSWASLPLQRHQTRIVH